MNTDAIYQRLTTMLNSLKERIVVSAEPQTGILWAESGYKSGSECPVLTPDNATVFGREDFWGGDPDSHAWFYKRIAVPKKADGIRYELRLCTDIQAGWDACNPQFILYFDGKPAQGMDLNHTTALLPTDREFVDVHIYAYTGTNLQTQVSLKLYMEIIAVEEVCEKLWYDLKVPAEVLYYSRKNTKEFSDILSYLNRALNLLDWRTDAQLYASCRVASNYLEREFYGKYCTKGNVTVKCIGHTHIDIAWLWSMRQTREKAQRTFATVLEMMKRYPDYKFMSSQVPLYQAVKEEAPELYEQIKQRIREGRWEVEGAMWVEPDCNLTSGESLVRQVLYGKRFFRQEFGVESKVLWLPDVFGYSAALPQILKKSGVDRFVTSKISWNDTNTLPNDTFWWEGIDGTGIFTHFLTAQEMHMDDAVVNFTTYNPRGNASYVMGAWNRYQNKDLCDEAILTFGYGDGGGGPTVQDVEMLRRMSSGIPGCPTTQITTATDFLDSVQEQTEGRLPKWTGELYFEFHRGTYTSQAAVKRNNRKAEFALHNLELMASTGAVLFGSQYPSALLAKLWQTVLVNQFHDVLPGSSIHEVYETANEELSGVIDQCEALTQKLLAGIAAKTDSRGLLVWNPTPFPTGGTVCYQGQMRYVSQIPANGFAVTQPEPIKNSITVCDRWMENDFFRVEFNANMEISRLYDKRSGREVLPVGKTANRLCLFEDFPHDCDAWEIRSYHTEHPYPLDSYELAEPVFEGERSGMRIVRKFGASTITQTLWLYEHMDRIDVDNAVCWQEKHHVLKAFFPVDVNAEKATFDIQFGNYERATHQNTSWQQAQFEVCAQKFADLSDTGFGMAVLNDCKYGYSVKDGEICLTLLRAPTYPDPTCDMGEHGFTYALYPHADDLRHSQVYRQAYLLNNPFRIAEAAGQGSLDPFSFVHTDRDHVIAETVKQAEDSNSWIVRLFESQNKSAAVTVSFGFPVSSVHLADLMEQNIAQLSVVNNTVSLPIKPFEILTLKVQRGDL